MQIDQETLSKARGIPLEATGEGAQFVDAPAREGGEASADTAGGHGGSLAPPAHEDPALDGAPQQSLEEKQREWRGVMLGVLKATSTTLDIIDAPVDLTSAEAEQLAEAWGDALGHFYEIRDGTKKGDVAKAVAETTVIGTAKLKQIRDAKDNHNDTGEAGGGEDVPDA